MAPGLYGWWAPSTVLPDLKGPAHPADANLRLLHVGIAARQRLRSRLGQNHMRRTGSSTLRRTSAGLLLDDETFRTRWTDRVVLVDEDELRLPNWMEKSLRDVGTTTSPRCWPHRLRLPAPVVLAVLDGDDGSLDRQSLDH